MTAEDPPAQGSALPALPDIETARERISALVHPSPVITSPLLSQRLGRRVWLKLENLHPPGSFKIRGAANKILSLDPAARSNGVITSSGGNHGAAVAYVSAALGVRAVVCVPENVDPVKLAAITRTGADAIVEGATFDDAVEISLRLAEQRGLTYVHPFDDPDVIAGQGTIFLEARDQVDDLGLIVAALSGGGLCGGIGIAAKSMSPEVRVVAASARNAATMAESVQAGHPVDAVYAESLAEVLVGGIGLDNRWSFAAVRDHVDEHVLVDESHLSLAMSFLLRRHRVVVEGGGAAPVASALANLLPEPHEVPGSAVLVVSGGNLDPARVVALGEPAV
ncbi:MAG TPA: threonine/serine dehydratase [Solirubrobacteraceae bacterium]|nr:threonine/serine dehydratase [Solirubrobacteraceae bacterium]